MATRNSGDKSFLNLLSFIAILVIGIGILVAGILSLLNLGDEVMAIVNLMIRIIAVVAIVFVGINSYNYARHTTKPWFIVWIVAIVVVVAGLILNFI